jgi:UDP-N-acetylglucosamine 2-epimerase (hydrolysing)
MKLKKIIFVTGTRADYGKLKSLIVSSQKNKKLKVYVFVTGMHNLKKFGSTWMQIKKKNYDNIKNVIRYNNQTKKNDQADIILSNTIYGFSKIAKKINPDLIIIHGDRIESLACSIVGSLNNFLVAHIEGGEVSGTIDELLRHAISKLSHLHFVTNKIAKKRLIQMGELEENIFIIGSPDIDIMMSKLLPSLSEVKRHYSVKFEKYGIAILHSVTTALKELKKQTSVFVKSLISSKKNFVVLYPNNDTGSEYILKKYKRFINKKNIKILPSMRFEYYLTLLKNAKLIIGNSSSGIIEAPYYGVPVINLGNRQNKRSKLKLINHLDFDFKKIKNAINFYFTLDKKLPLKKEFGIGSSKKYFENILKSKKIWKINKQKTFQDFDIK